MYEQINEQVTSLSVIDCMDIQQMTSMFSKISHFQKNVQKELIQNIDYGIIPGTDKPTLLKPGAEKIITLLGLTSDFELCDSTRNFDEGFFQYLFKARIYKNGNLITEGLGTCNSRESKYKKMDANSIDNTILKMAKKRALIDAALLVASLSQIFTQDIEDMDLTGGKPEVGQLAHDSVDIISKKQANLLYHKSNGNAELCKNVCKAFGYERSDQIKKIDFNAILAEIEAAANGA